MVRRALGLVALVLVAACAGDDSPALEGAVPTEASSPSSSTSTTVEPTTTAPPPACPDPAAPEGDAEPTEHRADLDGDSRDDIVHLESSADGGSRLQVELDAGGGAGLDLPAKGDAPVAVIGAVRLQPAEPAEVLWLRTGSGAATTIIGLVHLDGCDLVRTSFEDGAPVELAIGGTVGTVSGAECGPGVDAEADLRVREARYAGEQYEVVTTEYRWEDGVLVLSPAGAPTVSHTRDPSEVGRFACGDISL